jgi:hypothetical protein
MILNGVLKMKQCSSCGGDCKKTGCERMNIRKMTYEELDKAFAELSIENNKLKCLLRDAHIYVESQCEAEHMLDGFGGRKKRPTDDFLKKINEALND